MFCSFTCKILFFFFLITDSVLLLVMYVFRFSVFYDSVLVGCMFIRIYFYLPFILAYLICWYIIMQSNFYYSFYFWVIICNVSFILIIFIWLFSLFLSLGKGISFVCLKKKQPLVFLFIFSVVYSLFHLYFLIFCYVFPFTNFELDLFFL